MAHVLQLLPMLEGEEMAFVQMLLKDFTDNQAQQFAMIYSSRRRDPQAILLTSLLGFIGVAGIQRFLTDQIGMGILYLLTAGLCLVGTIVDIVNYKHLAFEYNAKAAQQVAMAVKSMS